MGKLYLNLKKSVGSEGSTEALNKTNKEEACNIKKKKPQDSNQQV
jgi:hypothetical protein